MTEEERKVETRKAWDAWQEDQKTNPEGVNPHAFVYGWIHAIDSLQAVKEPTKNERNCKGSIQFGNACGKCPRCKRSEAAVKEDKPAETKKGVHKCRPVLSEDFTRYRCGCGKKYHEIEQPKE